MNRMLKIVNEKFPPEAQENKILKDLIKNYSDVYSTEQDALQITPYFMCTIKQIDDAVVYRKPYTIPVSYHERVRAQLINLEKQGIIRPSRLSYNAPLIAVPKKDGGIILCLDVRALNNTLKDDKFPF